MVWSTNFREKKTGLGFPPLSYHAGRTSVALQKIKNKSVVFKQRDSTIGNYELPAAKRCKKLQTGVLILAPFSYYREPFDSVLLSTFSELIQSFHSSYQLVSVA